MQPRQLSFLMTQLMNEIRAASTIKFLEDTGRQSEALTAGQKNIFRETIFDSYNGFVRASANRDKKNLMADLKLEDIYNSQNIAKIIGIVETAEEAPIVFMNNPEYITLFQSFTSALKTIVSYSNAFTHFLDTSRYPHSKKPNEILDFDIVCPEKDGIAPSQLISILESIETLHKNISRVLGLDSTPINIVFMESGSNIKISIKGVAEVIEKIKTAIIQIWQQIRFRELDKFDRKLESVEKAVDLLVYIQEKQNKNELDGHEASLAVDAIWENTLNIIKAGALPSEEFESNDELNTEKLLSQKREIKQIEPPKSKGQKGKK